MLAWLMLPKVLLGVGALALVASIWGAVWWNTHGLKKELASTQEQLKTTQDAALEAAKEAARNSEREETNRIKLEDAITRNRQQTAVNSARIREVEATAAIAVMRAVKESRDASDALLDPSTVIPIGPEALNKWQDEWKRRSGVAEVK